MQVVLRLGAAGSSSDDIDPVAAFGTDNFGHALSEGPGVAEFPAPPIRSVQQRNPLIDSVRQYRRELLAGAG